MTVENKFSQTIAKIEAVLASNDMKLHSTKEVSIMTGSTNRIDQGDKDVKYMCVTANILVPADN